MKPFRWNDEKNQRLKTGRGIGFENVVEALVQGRVLHVSNHSNLDKYPGQRVFFIEMGRYVYVVPFREFEEFIYLITVIPSRKATKKYLGGSHEKVHD
jgi:uncharacterized DUF497 family protein